MRLDETVACDSCGAPKGSPCRTSSERRGDKPHVARQRRAERVVGGKGERARGADLAAIEDGAPSLQEVARDTYRQTFVDWHAPDLRTVKAWRVALACALLDKVYGARSAVTFASAMHEWRTPFGVLLAPPIRLVAAFRSLGLATSRTHRWRLASEKAIHEPATLGAGDSYEAQSIRLVVDGDTSFEPDDKVLRVVRRRMLKGSP